MRLDSYLKTCRLIRKRALAKELCGGGAITVNGMKAKAGKAIKEGDRILIDLWDRLMDLEVVSLPEGNVSLSEARELYRMINERKKPMEMGQ